MMFRLALLFVIPCVLCRTITDQIETPCSSICPTIYDPVCGTDTRTYANECVLRATQCKTSSLQIAHGGPCGSRFVRLICTTPVCWPTYEPVCGSDGITYGNGCEFSNAHCYNTYLKMEHLGPCTTPPKTDTSF